jgi:hypothetical protein
MMMNFLALKKSILTERWSKTQMNVMKHELSIVTGVFHSRWKSYHSKDWLEKLMNAHEASHCGGSSMKRHLEKSFWWNTLNSDVDVWLVLKLQM